MGAGWRRASREWGQQAVQAAVAADSIRHDIKPTEVADYLHALGAAGNQSSKAAVERLVQLTIDALRPTYDQRSAYWSDRRMTERTDIPGSHVGASR